MTQKYITQKQFINYLSYTPFFIWNDINDLVKEEKIEEVEDTFQWLRFTQEDLIIIDFNFENTYLLKDLKAVRIIESSMNDYIVSNWKNVYFIKSKKIDDAIKETLKVIKEKKHDFIINPIFKFNGAISRPKGFDIENQVLYSRKFSASTKMKDWCDVFWNYQIAKQNVKILDIKLIILSAGPNRRWETSFITTPTSNYQIASPSYKYLKIEEDGMSRYSTEVMHYKNLVKSGQKYLIENKKKSTSSFQSVFIKKKPTSITKNHIGNRLMSMDINTIIKNIKKAREIKEYTLDIEKEMLNVNQNILTNSNLKLLLKYYNHDTYKLSGSLMPKKKIAKAILEDDDSYKDNGVLKDIFNKKNVIDKERVLELISPITNPKNRIIWYDFEGYALPSATIDNFAPFQQTIFQVSIIETQDMKIKNVINKVYDPKILSPDAFVDIINNIYSLQAEVYVVYNKSYELTRINEMIDLLKFIEHPYAEQASEKAKWISKKTLDLAELFATRSTKNYPPILLHELNGMYSIKLIEKYITKHNIKLPYEILEYKNLEIQNGLMAMNTAIERALNIIGDKKWTEKVESLKEYCQNDVMAMIMVYDLAMYLIK